MRIAIDAMGGDHAPAEIVLGAVEAAQRDPETHIILCGDENAIREFLPSKPLSNIEIRHCSQVVAMNEAPSQAFRNKKDSGVAVATRLQKEGVVDVCLSAGNTGAASTFALFILGRIDGIDRPAIGTVFPTENQPIVVLDGGANVDCKPHNLADFALMGAAYIPVVRRIVVGAGKPVVNKSKPTVGLLSNGEEEGKGNDLIKTAFPLVRDGAKLGTYDFHGNVEGRDIFKGTADVVVCDGFVGNVVLKLAEGMAAVFMGAMKESLMATVRTKIGAMLAAPALRSLKQRFDHTELGGAVLLGVDGVCIICHGSAKRNSISAAVRVAKLSIEERVLEKIKDAALKQKNAREN